MVDVIILCASLIFIIFTIAAIMLLIYHFIVFPIRTKKWRLQIKKGDLCRFYLFDEKHTGRIEDVFGNSAAISFLNEKNQQATRISLITNIYPTW